jgi:hypothetical protein
MPDLQPEKRAEETTLSAEGEAALWLSESLILALLEADLLNTETILEAIDVVIAAKKAKGDEDRNPEVSRAAAAHLASISASIAAARPVPTGMKRHRRGGQRDPT